MAKKNALGGGLGDLLDDVGSVYQGVYETIDSNRIHTLHINTIKPNPKQPRKHFNTESLKELADSIKNHGLLQPILVVEDSHNSYMLIAGERRVRASKMAGMEEIQALVINAEEYKLRELALIENIQREDLNPIELAICYQSLIQEHRLTHEELSQKIYKSRSQITNTLRLLELSTETQELIAQNKITQGHAKILINLKPEDEKMVVQSILGQKLNVRDTESLVKKIKKNQKKSTQSNAIPHTPQEIEKESLSRESASKEITLEKLKLETLQQILYKMGIQTNISTNSITLFFRNNISLRDFIESLQSLRH